MERRIKELELRVRELEEQRDGLLSEFEAAMFPSSENDETPTINPTERDELNLLRRLRERLDEALRNQEAEKAQLQERVMLFEQADARWQKRVDELEERARTLEAELGESSDSSVLLPRLRAELEEARARGKRERVAATEAEAERARLDELVMAMRLEREDLMNSRDEHKVRADTLEIELRKLGDFAESGQSEQGALKTALEVATAELNALREGHASHNQEQQSKSNRDAELQKAELEKLHETVTRIESELREQRERYAKLEAESAADAAGWVEESEAAQARERALIEEVEALKHAAEDTHSKVEPRGSTQQASPSDDEAAEALEEARTRIRELEAQLRITDKSVRESELWITQLESERDEAKARVEELGRAGSRGNAESAPASGNDRELAAEAAAQAEALEELRARFEFERHRAEELEAQLAELLSEPKLEPKSEDEAPEESSDSAELDSLRTEVVSLRAERETLVSDLDLARERASMVVEKLRTRIDDLESKLSERDAQIEDLLGASDTGSRPQILSASSVHAAMIDQLKEDHATLATTLAEAETVREGLSLRCEELLSQVEEREARITELQSELEAERSSLDETRLQAEHAGQLRGELAELASLLAEKTARVEELESELQRKLEQEPTSGADSSELAKKLATLEDERHRLASELEGQKEAKERLIRSKALLQTQLKREESAREDAQRLLKLKDKALGELREKYEGTR